MSTAGRHTFPLYTMVVFVLVVSTMLQSVGARSAYVMSRDTDDWTPDYVWMLDPGQQRVSNMTDKIPIYLHNAEIVTGPSYAEKSIGAVQFLGDSSSFGIIENRDNRLNTTHLFTWMMLVKPASLTQQGVIFEVSDGAGGIKVKQDYTRIQVTAHGTDGFQHTIPPEQVFASSEWTFIAITYANFKIGTGGEELILFYGTDGMIEYSTHKVKHDVATGTVLQGTGDIRLGASADVNERAFRGQIACVRYHHKLMVKTLADHTVSCDPNDDSFADMLNSLSGSTVPVTKTTTAIVVTTDATTQQQTTSTETISQEPTTHILENTTPTETRTPEHTSPMKQTTVNQETSTEPTETTTKALTKPQAITSEETVRKLVFTTEQLDTTTPEAIFVYKETTNKDILQEETVTTQDETASKPTTVQFTSPQGKTSEMEETTTGEVISQAGIGTTEMGSPSKPKTVTTYAQTIQVDKTSPEAKLMVTEENTEGQAANKIFSTNTVSTTRPPSGTLSTVQEATTPAVTAELLSIRRIMRDCPMDTCVHLLKRPEASLFSEGTEILANITVDSLNACAGACISVHSCVAVAVETAVVDGISSGSCMLGSQGFVTIVKSGFYVYTLDTVY